MLEHNRRPYELQLAHGEQECALPQLFYEEKHREFLTETLSGHLKTTIKMKESEANRMLSELREGETIPELFDRLMASKQITRDGDKLTFVPAPKAPDVGWQHKPN